jgi:hypothetical protein
MQETLKQHQPAIEKLLKLVVMLKSAAPKPVRNLLAKCYSNLYVIGDTRSLFENIQQWNALLMSSLKSANVEYSRLVVMNVVSSVVEISGLKVLSMGQEIMQILLKMMAKFDKELHIKLESIICLSKSLVGLGKAVNEPMHKEIEKIIKLNLQDKHLNVRIASAQCLQSLLMNSMVTVTVQDIEALIASCIKAFEDSNYSLRKSLSSLIATGLASTQGLTHISVQASKKKPVKHDTQENIQNVAMFTILSNAFIKNFSSSRYCRIGLAETYGSLFQLLGSAYLQEDLKYITSHVVELVANPKLCRDESDVYHLREIIRYLLRQLHSGRTADENAKIKSVQVIADLVKFYSNEESVKSKPLLLPQNIQHTIVCCLNELASLFEDLGCNVSAAQEVIVEPLISILMNPSFAVQIYSANALNSLVIAQPALLSLLINRLISNLEKDLPNLSFSQDSIMKRFQGSAFGLSALLNAVKLRPLYVSFDLLARIFTWASEVLKKPTDPNNPIISFQHQMAWTVLIPMMSLGTSFVKLHMTQLLLLLGSFFTRVSSDDPIFTSNPLTVAFFLNSKLTALSVIYTFLKCNSKDLITPEVSKRIVKMLENSVFIFAIQNYDHSEAFQKRLFQCFGLIHPVAYFETSHSTLLEVLFRIVTIDDSLYCTSNVLTMLNPDDVAVAGIPRQNEDKDIESQMIHQEQGGLELDSLVVFSTSYTKSDLPQAPIIAVLDEAISLFGLLLCFQKVEVQEEIIGNFFVILNTHRGGKDSHNIETNILAAFNCFLVQSDNHRIQIESSKVLELSQGLLQRLLIHSNPVIRCIATETLGKMVKLARGQAFSGPLIQILVEQVINNKDPEARASYGLALGCIYRQVGGTYASIRLL